MSQWETVIVRSNRKTLSLQIKPDGTLLVRAPLCLPKAEIEDFLREKSPWIEKNLAKVKDASRAGEEAPLSMEDIRALADEAMQAIPPRVRRFAERMGVTYGRITIRNQRTRWGSCSSDGNLNFNCLLMRTPDDVLEYVVVHELCHRKEMNHSPKFWAEVERVLPNYRESKRWLKENGSGLIRSLP